MWQHDPEVHVVVGLAKKMKVRWTNKNSSRIVIKATLWFATTSTKSPFSMGWTVESEHKVSSLFLYQPPVSNAVLPGCALPW